jgi:hypothetical protein
LIVYSKLPLNYLIPAGNALLTLSTGFSVLRAIRQRGSVEQALIGLAVGMLGMSFYPIAIQSLQQLSQLLESDIQKLGNPQTLKDLVFQSIQSAADEAGPNGEKYKFNIPAVVEQVFRTGVWGIASTIGDFFFLLAGYFIEVRRDVLIALVQFLFPLVWGLYPAIPTLGNSIIAYLLEMALWGPCLILIQIILGYLAPQYLQRSQSLGVPLVALEIVATLLMLEIPGAVHRLLQGTLHPAGESVALGMIFVGARAVKAGGKVNPANSSNRRKIRRDA